jgi:hypothetical protein
MEGIMSILDDLLKIDKNDDKKIYEFLCSIKRVDMANFESDEFDEEAYRLLLKYILVGDFSVFRDFNKRLILPGLNLREAYLAGADLRGADLREADLERSNLEGAFLREADLSGADLELTNLGGAYLKEANLRGADLNGADLRGAYLSGADLGGAYLRGVDLRGVDLREADLREVNLTKEQRNYAQKNGAIVDGIIDDLERETKDRHLENLIQKLNSDLADQKTIYEKSINDLKATQEKSILNAVKAELKDLEEKSKEDKKNVKKAQTAYIRPSIIELKKRKCKMHSVALICFFLGVISLIIACLWIYDDFGFYTNYSWGRLSFILGGGGNCSNMTEVIVRSTRLIAGVLILAALAKFFYSLGKSFMHEAVKCSDCIHAIRFGQFFLQAFPIPETHRERREIFSEWNREGNSAFFNMSPGDIDPRLVEAINALKSISPKDAPKKE